MSNLPATSRAHTPKRVAKMASNEPENLNHLLNFTLPPRQVRPVSSIPRRSRKTGTAHAAWNKERFVNAQYRFVMNPNGDYTVHFADPDIFFQWSDILQVIIPRSSVLASATATGEQTSFASDTQTSCPICLSPPTAPRMTKCGHIFCFPCILHYLSTSDNKWARCPICFDSVNERQLKSVKWFDGHAQEDVNESAPEPSSSSTIDNTFESAPRSGSYLRMLLIERPQITTLALPRSPTWPSELLPPHQAPFHFLPDIYNFAKFMLATPSYLVSGLTRDLDELATERRLLAGMKDDLGVLFVDGADVKVKQEIDRATALDTSILRDQIEKALGDQQDIEGRVAFHEKKLKNEGVLQEEIPTEFLSIKTPGTRTPVSAAPADFLQTPGSQDSQPRSKSQLRNHSRQRRNINPPPPTTQTYYYYQAASGLPIYLHPLDIRILLSHFSSYSSFPDTITVRVDAFSESTIDDDLRKRCKYLAHMPESADVVFIEADLEGVVGAEALKIFEGPLRSRASKRREKGKKEDRAKVKAEEREREREREKQKSWTSSAASSISHSTSGSIRSPQPAAGNFSALVASEAPQDSESPDSTPLPQQQQQISGAWGARSFASALHSPPTQSPGSRGQQRDRTSAQDEWDLDIAWHELEQRSGGRRKKGTKLVVLGGDGGRRR